MLRRYPIRFDRGFCWNGPTLIRSGTRKTWGEAAPDSNSEIEDYRWLYNSTLEQNDTLKEEIKALRSELESLKRQLKILPSTEDRAA